MKKCKRCKIIKSLDKFYKCKNKKDGLCYICKQCASEYHKNIYLKNKEKKLLQSKIWKKENRDKMLKWQREYNMLNRTRSAQWAIDNKEHLKPFQLANWQRYYAHKRNLPNTLTGIQVQKLFTYFNNACAVCGSNEKLALDHYISLKNILCPGTIAANITLLCQKCNSSKNKKLPLDWLLQNYNFEIAHDINYKILQYFSTLEVA